MARVRRKARDEIWEELLTILVDKHEADEDVSPDLVRRSLAQNTELTTAFNRACRWRRPSR